jgi:2-polyprenyl-6-methoxyphenol hydroxylase-like FAD-dependent oxidoreductase
MEHDIIIVGAGPAGLSFARAVADTGLRVCLLERQAASVLANPPLDGRDIALTHDSMRLMRDLGMWQHIPVGEISPIKSARVISGESAYFLGFDTEGTGKDALGVLVPNNEIRRAAWKSLEGFDNVVVRDKVEVKKVAVADDRATVTLADGEKLSAPLLIAAYSRFSATRAQMSIPVGMKDFGRTAIVCRMTHAKAHDEVAHECFLDRKSVV